MNNYRNFIFWNLTVGGVMAFCWIFSVEAAGKSSDKLSTIEVSNPSSFQREELAEIGLGELGTLASEFILRDKSGNEVPYQLTYDGKLVFPVTISGNSSSRFVLEAGKASNKFPRYVYGRQFPERKDDFAWENERSAYRAYGPALERSGEKAYGYDIWSKSVAYPVLEQRYYDDRVNRISFHDDHGNGMDGYGVGPTLGGGTSALLSDAGEIVYPYCYKDFEVLDDGPLRMTVKLIYNPVRVDGDKATETRIISLDKGSWLNKTSVTYDGLTKNKRVVQGIVVHTSNPSGYDISDTDKFLGYTDMTDKPAAGNGEIYVGIVSPTSYEFKFLPIEKKIEGVEGHVAAIAEYKPGETLTYWWGSGWSKGGVKDSEGWIRILKEYSDAVKNPLKVRAID